MIEDVHFERDTHAYYDGEARVPSVTQVIKIAGLISYDNVKPDVLENARRRGSHVHTLTADYDRGLDIDALYEIPEVCLPYLDAYIMFRQESGFEPYSDSIERPIIASIGGFRVGMTPDRLGTCFDLPTVLEIKATAAAHPAWGVQTAGYEAGAPRPKGYRNYQRLAVQLLPTGKYKLHTYEDNTDFTTFYSAYAVAAFKLKHRLAEIE